MKHILLMINIIIIGLLSSHNVQAFPATIRVYYYEAEGKLIYDVRGCVPGSQVAFYSEIGGGKHLRDDRAGIDGSLVISADKKFNPAFALNLKDNHQGGTSGNGMVAYVGNKEFTLSDIYADNNEGYININWNATVSHPENYKLRVYKSIDGNSYTIAATIPINAVGPMSYNYSDPLKLKGDVFYKLRITDSLNEISYTSKPIHFSDIENDVKVYPTLAREKINLVLSNMPENIQYKILNTQGQVLLTGRPENMNTPIPIENIPAGNYMIQVVTDTDVKTVKFVKQ